MKTNSTAGKSPLEKTFILLTILLLAFFVIKCVSVTLTYPFSFDGGMNAQVAHNLAHSLNYSTSYDTNIHFDPIIQTGIPVLLPVAIFFRIFGESFASGLAINAIYLILLLLAIIYYEIVALKFNIYFVFLSVLLFFGTPSLFNFGFGLYGELPALFFFMLFLVLYQKYQTTNKKNFLLFAGLSFGLGYLTKTVILIALPAIAAAFILDFLTIPNSARKRKMQDFALLILGMLLPILLFETYKLFSLGFPAYSTWWSEQFKSILMQAGVKKGYSDTDGILIKFITHLKLLSASLIVHYWIIIAQLAVLVAAFALISLQRLKQILSRQTTQLKNDWVLSNDFYILLVTTLSYFGWWLLITPTLKAFYRRIIDGTILFEICFIAILFLLYQWIPTLVNRSKVKNPGFLIKVFSVSFFLLIFASASLFLLNSSNHLLSFQDTPTKTSILEAAKIIKKLPEKAILAGYGWWQSPNISFASGRNFSNYYKISTTDFQNSKKPKYLVVENFNFDKNKSFIKNILFSTENKIVYSRNDIYIYHLIKKYSPPKIHFTTSEKLLASSKSFDFTEKSTENNPSIKNVYWDKADPYIGKWAQPESAYLLKFDQEKFLKVKLFFPDLDNYHNDHLVVSIFINNMLVSNYKVEKPGLQIIDVPLENIHAGTISLKLALNAHYVLDDDPRNLGFLIQSINFSESSSSEKK